MEKSYMTKHHWNDEEDKWLKDNFYPKIDRDKMLSEFNSTFNTNITTYALNQRLYKYRLLTPNSDYTPEMEQWLKDNYRLDTKSAQELTIEFNRVFNTKKTKSSIWHKAYRVTNQRLSEAPRNRLNYTTEMIEKIKEIVPKWSYKKCAEIMSEEFNYKFTSSMIEHKANRLGIKKPNNGFDNLDPRLPSINWFMKGRPSLNEKPVGTETVMTDKNGHTTVAVKIGKPNVWEYKHRLIWKQHHGEIPKNGYIIFADGNCLNFDINNLVLVSPAEHVIMNKHGLRFDDTELTKTGLNVAKLILAKNEVKKKRRKIK